MRELKLTTWIPGNKPIYEMLDFPAASASIVLYENSTDEISVVVNSFLGRTPIRKIFLVDNSRTDRLGSLYVSNPRVEYIFNNKNMGFGPGHNIAIGLASRAGFEYHFVSNPDISFDRDIVTPMVSHMSLDERVGMMMPEVLNPGGSIQYTPKLLPTPFWMFRRKLQWPTASHAGFIDFYELRSVPKDRIYNVPFLSGCFLLFRLKAIEKIGRFDERFFMYFEDVDISRRMHEKYLTLYFPSVSVVHKYKSGANKNFKLFNTFVLSGIRYFNKWGWLIDSRRTSVNGNALAEINKKS